MAEPILVHCGEGRPAIPRGPWRSADVVRLQIGNGPRDIHLRLDHVQRALAATLPPLLTDLMEIAAYVHGGDQVIRRGGTNSFDYGEGWRRHVRFEVPVRQPDVWRQPAVLSALTECLEFLLDDQQIEFGFRPSSALRTFDDYLFDSIDPSGQFDVDEVVLFSGGVDSLAGALCEIHTGHAKTVLVSHKSVSKVASRQHKLVQALRQRAPTPMLAPRHVALTLNKGKNFGWEFTQRSRSFVFSCVAALVARLFGLNRIRFYENGVTSINLPISPQMIGGRASRTTHPRVLRSFERLFTLLFEVPFAVENPFQWKTKAEVFGIIAALGHTELIAHTVSCVKTKQQTVEHTHCGRCSQCIDRRLAAIAAGLHRKEDPREHYLSDVLTGPRENEDRLLVERFCGMALQLRSIPDALRFVQQYPEVAAVCRAVDLPASDAVRRVYELMRRNAEQVSSAISRALAEHAEQIATHELDPTCLLSLVCTRNAGNRIEGLFPSYRNGVQNGDAKSIVVDDTRFEVVVHGRPCVLGKTLEFRLFQCLAVRLGQYVEHDLLADEVWGDEEVRKHSIYRVATCLRRKLKQTGIQNLVIDGDQDDHYRMRFSNEAPISSARHQLER